MGGLRRHNKIHSTTEDSAYDALHEARKKFKLDVARGRERGVQNYNPIFSRFKKMGHVHVTHVKVRVRDNGSFHHMLQVYAMRSHKMELGALPVFAGQKCGSIRNVMVFCGGQLGH